MPDPEKSTALELIEEQAEAHIRREWVDDRWYFSVVDVIGLLTEAPKPRQYWYDMRRRITDEGFRELSALCRQLKMRSGDGKYYRTDAADTETLLRIIQSVPSPKAEPVKQWLARVGAKRLDEVTRPIDVAQASTAIAAIPKPSLDAPPAVWADYHEQLMVLYRRQAAYEARLAYVDAHIAEHDAQIGELHSRVESLEAGQRLLPDILERLGPQTLSPEHQATVKAMAKRLNDLTGVAYAGIYADLNQSFHAGKYSDISEEHWPDVVTWLQQRIDAAMKRRGR
jgi:hypothetical protein